MSKLNLKEEIMNLNFSKDEVKTLEETILHRKEGVGLEAKYIKNEYLVRINSYDEMLSKVRGMLESDEELLISKINIPCKSGTAGMSTALYYQCLFFTNKRLFAFNMGFKYNHLDNVKIYSLNDICDIKYNSELDDFTLQFKNSEFYILKYYSKDERTLNLIIIKFLLDKGVKLSSTNKLIEKLFY